MQKITCFVMFFSCSWILLITDQAFSAQGKGVEKISMGPFGEKKVYVVSPPFEGRLLNAGKPLANTKIIRRVQYYGKDDWVEEDYKTDGDGYFNIPALDVTMRLSFLAQFTASTALYIETTNQDRLIWNSFSGEENMHSQFLDVKPVNFICDLTIEETYRSNGVSNFVAKCVWDNMPSNDLDSI